MGHSPGAGSHPWVALLPYGLHGTANGTWAVACVWVDAAAVLHPSTNTDHQPTSVALSGPAPTQSLTPDWVPYQGVPHAMFEPGAHPFGATESMAYDLLGNLSPEDAQFLSASFVSNEPMDETMKFVEESGGTGLLGLQQSEEPLGGCGFGPADQSNMLPMPPTLVPSAISQPPTHTNTLVSSANNTYITPTNESTAFHTASSFESSDYRELAPQSIRTSNTKPRASEFDPNAAAPAYRATSALTPTPVGGTQTQVPHVRNRQFSPSTVAATTPHTRRHSTQIGNQPSAPALRAESPDPNTLRRRASAGYHIPSVPAVGGCPPLRHAPDTTVASRHVSAPNTPALRLRPSLPQLRGLAVSTPGSRTGSPFPSSPRSRSPFLVSSRPASPLPSTPLSRVHQAARSRSISPPRSPNVSTPTLQTYSPLPGTPLRFGGNQDSGVEQASYLANDGLEPDYSPDEPTLAPRVHRQRTPPPLTLNGDQGDPTLTQVSAQPEGRFFIDGSPPAHAFRVEPQTPPRVSSPHNSIPSPLDPLEQPHQRGQTPAAPTLAEFVERRATEIRELQNVRKFDPPAGQLKGADDGDAHMNVKEQREREGKGKGGIRRIWTYSHSAQSIMSLIRADMQHSYLDLGPFNNYLDNQRFRQALEFVKTISVYAQNVDTVADDEFYRTMKKTFGQLRTAGQDDIKTEVSAHFRVKEGETQKIEWLLQGDRCMYPGGNMVPEDFLKTDLASNILVHMYFGTSRGLGYIYLDRQLKSDDPKILQELLEFVTEQNLANPAEVEPVRIVDDSPEASYGPSLAAIAFVAINIRHALERLKAPAKPKRARVENSDKNNKKGKKSGKDKGKRNKAVEEPVRSVEFTETAYGAHWARYVRMLANHPHLGVIRQRFLTELKNKYVEGLGRSGRLGGGDRMW
ncbi:hypothetical protein FRC09_004712 [Ceratobasidium sp. 395]|nr:hypothetical protein FRC09_004712 [Ceratobasidium sp. 395]